VITRTIIRPENCAIAFGIPTDELSFARAMKNRGSDYVRRYLGGFTQYEKHLLKDLDRFLVFLAKWNVHVERTVTAERLSALLSGAFDVVTLFSHGTENSVEFTDGLVEVNSIVDCVPLNYSGFIDLCVCHPLGLVNELKFRRPNCHVKWEPLEVEPVEWMYIYPLLFSELARGQSTYLQAWKNVIIALSADGQEEKKCLALP
jgi:hypothetical protein